MTRNQIGLILNHRDTFNHFRNILEHLFVEEFEIVICGDREALEALAQKHGYSHVWYKDHLGQEPRYRYTLANYFMLYYDLVYQGQVTGKLYLVKMLGQKAIRMMYTLGVDYWNYGEWNKIFDLQLCYGPWQAERLKDFGAPVYQIGYPRYDDYFNQPIDREDWLRKLGADPQKPTLVWLPTRYQHTLRYFGPAVSRLAESYNLLVKPHPLTWDEEPGLIRWLETLELTLVRELDNLYLYALADFVICDYGGAAFGAIYTDRPLLLFNHHPETHFDPHKLHLVEAMPTTSSDQATTVHELNPTELYLRESIANLYPNQQDQLRELLTDQAFWEAQKTARARLREQFFAPYYGSSSKRVASILQHLLRH